ncbi:MAG: ABC transporter permease [Rhizobiaceae bacterium]|nr:ABC transporter permease [Rhizobiaceae bacterium]
MFGLDTFIATAVSASAPIVATAVGGAFAERARCTNIGMEGMMLMGAFTALSVSVISGSAWLGLLAGIAVGALGGVFLSVAVHLLTCDIIIAGIGFNMMVSGVTLLLIDVFHGESGTWAPTRPPLLPRIDLGAYADTPLIGLFLHGQSVLVLVILAVVVLAWIVESRSRFGRHIRAVGDNLEAVVAAGLNPTVLRTTTLAISGATAGLGGSFLAISALGVFAADMSGGLGFIALAAVIFAGASVVRSALVAVLFGLSVAFATQFQSSGLPVQFVLMTPYVATILGLLLVGVRRRSSGNPPIINPTSPIQH